MTKGTGVGKGDGADDGGRVVGCGVAVGSDDGDGDGATVIDQRSMLST